jgi:hypothetical protein
LRKAFPTLRVWTSFNIVASCATELSGCDYSAEVEMRLPEGAGEMTHALSDAISALVDGSGSHLGSGRIYRSCISPKQDR